jgi:D-sedoheptulose 7-phosphate isomerase
MDRDDARVAFARRYVEELCKVARALPFEDLGRALAILEEAHDQRRRVFLIGNGGSAATASHMANDLLHGVRAPGGEGLRALALGDGLPLLTAVANDDGYEQVFAKPLRTLAERGDVLVAISGSGNSPNVLRAVATASELGLRTIGFLGRGGGAVFDMLEVAVVVPSDDYGPIEDLHLAFDHLVTAWLRRRAGGA